MAALLNSTIMSGYFVDKMTATIENEKKLSHEKVRRLRPARGVSTLTST